MNSRAVSSWRGALCALIIITVLNIAFVAHFLRILERALPAEVSYSYVGDDYPTELPYKPPAAALVFADPSAPHFALLSDEDWASAFPLNFGFVSPASFSPSSPSNRTFQLAMLHQVHCLDVFRVAFARGGRARDAAHVEHCLRYMRQTVLCHADTTLEPSGVGVHHGRLEHMSGQGYGSVHRCRDWTALRRYLLENPPVDLGVAPEV